MNLKEIIDASGVEKKIIAATLFPKHEHPTRAFDRLISGESILTVEQLQQLAKLLGIGVDKLLITSEWRAAIKDNIYVFTRPDYTAVLNLNTGWTTLSKSGEHKTEFLLVQNCITLREYLETLNKTVNGL